MGGLSGIFIIIIIGGLIWWFIKKKKNKGMTDNNMLSTRRSKDEVWKTIKQYLKDNNEYGKEIIDSYVVKRNHVDYINPNWTRKEKENKKAEIKIRNFYRKQEKKAAKLSGKTYEIPPVKDLYVVAFTSRDTKSLNADTPRAIECEVLNKKINKKEWDRKILINGALNYDEEMEWIAPIKVAEKIKSAKAEEKSQKLAIKNQKRIHEKLMKEKEKSSKNAKKNPKK